MTGKALSLSKLENMGFNVPRFFVCHKNFSKQDLLKMLDLMLPQAEYFAVRSSASVEDSNNKSYAGHFYTGIGIARDSVFNEFLKVKESFGDIDGEVIIQEFVASDLAGVIFSKVQHDNMVINATYGLCEAVVQGQLCDEYVCDPKGFVISKNIEKFKPCKFFIDGKMKSEKISDESLNEVKIAELIRVASQIEKIFGAPQDIEWCFKGDKIYVLQSRAITTDFDVIGIEYYDSANIAESYSGVVLPLTCTFAKMVYSEVYKDFLQMSGVSRKKIERNSKVFDGLLGFFNGRMYYNMNNWYKMAEFVPGYNRNKSNFELMITSNIKNDVAESIRPSLGLKILYPLIVLIKTVFFSVTAYVFKKQVENHLKWIRGFAFDKLDYAGCIHMFHTFNKKMLSRWYVTLENDFFVMTYLGVLKKLIGENELQKYIIFNSKSTEQISELVHLSNLMYKNKIVWDQIIQNSIDGFNAELLKNSDLKKALDNYLNLFGGRFANELKLESIGVDEDVYKLFSVLRIYKNFYSGVEQKKYESVKMPIFKRLIFKFFLSRFKKYASRREEFRLLRSNTFGMTRRLFRRMGQILVEACALEVVDDVFYLKLEELLDYNAVERSELGQIIAKRKKDYETFSKIKMPSHFSAQNGLVQENAGFIERLDTKSIKARPASSGVIQGKVKIFKEFVMPENVDFDIIVTSHTDPGWTSLIALSKGLIIEHGGVLSHASIVARELGIPAVIGAKDATDLLADGMVVEIDGSTGAVRII